MKIFTLALVTLFTKIVSGQQQDMIIRISEIEIHAQYLSEYKSILKEEAAASVKLEKGVVAIFPMDQKVDSTQIRILEIYATREAYESHLKTPHFQKYKTSTLKMVRSLRLIDMNAIDPETLQAIFKRSGSSDH
jgi:quinol monooxygenase YgiN